MRRRHRGEGALYQRHDAPTCPPRDPETGDRPAHRCEGRWVGHLVTVNPDGRKRRKAVYGRTQKEARIKLATATRERDAGTLTVGRMTVETWVRYWLANVAAATVKPQTFAAYSSKAERLIIPHLGAHKLTALTPEHIDQWLIALRDHGSHTGGPLSEGTVQQAHAVLQSALSSAVKRKHLRDNPILAANKPKPSTTTRPMLSVDDGATVLDAAGMDARWWLALFYGMRQGEVLGLRWADVDLDAATLTVTQTAQVGIDRATTYGPPKTRGSARTIPLLPPILLRLRAHQPAGIDPAELVFTRDGAPITRDQDRRAWRALLASCGLEPVALHTARNTAASLMEAAGVPDRLAMQILGHSRVHQTHAYTRADLDRQREVLGLALQRLALE